MLGNVCFEQGAKVVLVQSIPKKVRVLEIASALLALSPVGSAVSATVASVVAAERVALVRAAAEFSRVREHDVLVFIVADDVLAAASGAQSYFFTVLLAEPTEVAGARGARARRGLGG